MAYCVQPFINIRIDSGPEFKPCCHYKDNIHSKTLDQYLGSTELSDLRQHLLTKDSLPAGCILCQNQENKGQTSFRQKYNDFFGVSDQQSITHLEIMINNTCNLKCFMCDPMYSTALGSEHKSLGWVQSYPTINHHLEALSAINSLPDLRSVSFIGGEFFFSKDSISLLEIAVARDLKINVATNATVLLDKHIDFLKQIREVDIQISLDGIQQSYDFMRYPATWDTVSDNISVFKKILPAQSVHVSSVAQPLNIQYMAPLMEWCNQNLLKIDVVNLQSPLWLEWRILQQPEKTKIINVLNSHLKQHNLTTKQKKTLEQFEQTILMAHSDSESRQQFISKMKSILALRNIPKEKILQHFGVLSDLANSIIKET